MFEDDRTNEQSSHSNGFGQINLSHLSSPEGIENYSVEYKLDNRRPTFSSS